MDFCSKEIKKPCGGCPFGRVNDNEKPNPGGSHPEVYLGQIHGPYWLPCHNDKHYVGKGSDPSKVKQCAGASIFRANVGSAHRMPKGIQQLPADSERVFADEAEFYSYYTGRDEDELRELLTDEYLRGLFFKELSKAGVRTYK